MGEKQLLDQLAALPREISPTRDPWPEISARIERAGSPHASGRRSARWLTAVAASTVIAVLAGLLFSQSGYRSAQGTNPAETVYAALDDAAPMRASRVSAEAEYLAAFREFTPLGESRTGLEPATVAMLEEGWAELQSTESALALALQDNPDDKFLSNRMLELRARQLGFLKQLASLDMNNRRLTI